MSGSGKKHKDKGPTWFDCSKCQRRFTRQSVTRHHELDCGIIHPFMEGTALYINLNKINKNSPAEIRRLPFLNNTRYASGVIFMSHTLILECSLEAFGWVTVSAIGKDKDGKLSKLDDSNGYALLVWPIFESPNNQPYLSLMTENGFKVNSMLTSKMDEVCCVKVERLSFSYSMPIFLSASEITVEVTMPKALDGMNLDLERFTQNVRDFIIGRVVSNENRFQIRIFTEMIPIVLKNIQVRNFVPSSNTMETDFSALRISAPDEQTVKDFYEVTDKTVINVVEIGKVLSSDTNIITIRDVGGLKSAIEDAQCTIKFFLSNTRNDREPRGLLFYGHTGTGKSLLVRALCSHNNLHVVFYDGLARNKNESHFSIRNSFTKAVNEAILRSPAAVVIENIDSYNSKKQNSNQQENVNFANALRSCSESLSKNRVILLATTCDIDSVDPDLRSQRIFAKEIETIIPSAPEREDILNKLLNLETMNGKHSLTPEDVKSIAEITHGFVGADLKGLCSRSKMSAILRALQERSEKSEAVNECIKFEDFQDCLKWLKPSAMRTILVDVPNVRWSDIGGQTDLKFKLKQAIEWPLKHPEAFRRLGIKPPKGILMYGPPGCSKTMIAKAIATESGLNFISVKGSELFSKWVGDSEKAVQTLFRKARQVAPSVIFFDEIDSLGGERGSTSGSSNVHERVLAQLLVEIDGIVPLKDVTIVAATNRPDIIDPALLRPGRLDRIIYVPMPDVDTRKDILKVRFQKMPVDSQVNLEKLVQLTEGYSGAEVTAVCHEAALKALEENIEATLICDKHFLSALDVVRPRISAEQISFYENYHKSRKM